MTWVLQLSRYSTPSSTCDWSQIEIKGLLKIIEKRWEASEYLLPPGRWHRSGLVCPPGSVCWGGWWWWWHRPGLTRGWSPGPRASGCWPGASCGSCGQSPHTGGDHTDHHGPGHTADHSALRTPGWSSPLPPAPLSAQSSDCKRMCTARSPPQTLTLCTQFSPQGSRFLCQQSSWLESPLIHRLSQILGCRPPLPWWCSLLCSCIWGHHSHSEGGEAPGNRPDCPDDGSEGGEEAHRPLQQPRRAILLSR